MTNSRENRVLWATRPPDTSSFGVGAQRGAVDFAVISAPVNSHGYRHSCSDTDRHITADGAPDGSVGLDTGEQARPDQGHAIYNLRETHTQKNLYRRVVDAISVSGVQGTGKTTLARALGRATGAVVLSRAPLMDVALAAGAPVDPPQGTGLKGVGDLAYDLQTALLREQLDMGHSVVLDCGADWLIREGWRKVADGAGAHFWLVDTVCSDETLHRRRFEARGAVWRCDVGQTWEMVDDLRIRFQVHPQAAFIADAVRPVDENVSSILALIRGMA
jgi:predicted kinase